MTDGTVVNLLAGALGQLQSILDTIDAGVIVRDADGKLLYANDAAAIMTGYASVAEFLAADSDDTAKRFHITDEFGRALALADLPSRRAQRGETPSQVVLRWRATDGTEHWSEVRSNPVFDEGGDVTHFVVVFRDITAQRQVEEARQRLAFLAEASNILASSLDYEVTLSTIARLAVPKLADWCSVYIADEAGVVRQLAVAHIDPEKVAFARALQERYPYNPDAPYGVPSVIRTRQPQLASEIPPEALNAAVQDEYLRDVLRQLHITSSMIVPLIARGRVLGAMSFISAETGRNYTEEDLQLAEDLAARAALAVDNARLYAESVRTVAEQATILERMTDGVLFIDAVGVVRYLNQTAQDILGVNPIGWHVRDLMENRRFETVDGERVSEGESAIMLAMGGETALNVDRRLYHSDGRGVVVRISAAPIVIDEEAVGAVAVLNDITAAFDLERQKDAFLAAAAHDLKTPLTTIKGLSQMMQRRVETAGTERVAQGLEQIDRAATRMNRLVNELLDATRFQMGVALDLSPRPGDLVALVRRMADEFGRGPQQNRIQVEASASEIMGVWDLDRLERVIANLLSNAIKYSPGGGPVTVSLRREGGDAVMTVRDEGVGIPAADVPHIFQRFYRGRNVDATIPGTGLGLYGVKHIVERHGGTIEVESREGEGSLFTLRIPLSPPGL